MLLYISILNLLSDWTCYSVAPISILTAEAFGAIDPESLVTIFLAANAVASAAEPVILRRLGLRRTVVFGSLLLMLGSIVKSGGIPLFFPSNLEKGRGEWRVYLGFFMVGLSQPLYQCTPALLSASWFPEQERTMATGVALNSNQLGIGFAFVFGTLLVASSDDIVPYFEGLSVIATLVFVGCALQFDDAPPTPPSDTARIIRGTLEVTVPTLGEFGDFLGKSVRSLPPWIGGAASSPERAGTGRGASGRRSSAGRAQPRSSSKARTEQRAAGSGSGGAAEGEGRSKRPGRTPAGAAKKGNARSGSGGRESPRRSGARRSSSPRKSSSGKRSSRRSRASASGAAGEKTPPMPSAAFLDLRPVRPVEQEIAQLEREAVELGLGILPSPMMPGPVGNGLTENIHDTESLRSSSSRRTSHAEDSFEMSSVMGDSDYSYASLPPDSPFPHLQYGNAPLRQYMDPAYGSEEFGGYYVGPDSQVYGYYPAASGFEMYPAMPPQQYYGRPYGSIPYQQVTPAYSQKSIERNLPVVENPYDEGAEPVLVQTANKLDIDVRDDQVLLSLRACFSRPGFTQTLAAFTVSGIVINTLSTYMDYLVRLGGAGREYVGMIGGLFQLLIMISSLLIGAYTDRTRAYYSVAMAMLVFGAFGLSLCGVNLDEDEGNGLRWSLLLVGILVGPLQPISTELGVEVVYPLSENTVLVIQQLFANLLSALFIPLFKALKDVNLNSEKQDENGHMIEKPQYTFSFYLLIVLHATVTFYVATFRGRYHRLEAELEKKRKKEEAAEAYVALGSADAGGPGGAIGFGSGMNTFGHNDVGSFDPVYDVSYQHHYEQQPMHYYGVGDGLGSEYGVGHGYGECRPLVPP